MRVRRAVAAARAVPCGARAAGYAPRPLGVESSGSAAPLPATGECSSGVAPWPVTAECGKVRSVARARGAPRQLRTVAQSFVMTAENHCVPLNYSLNCKLVADVTSISRRLSCVGRPRWPQRTGHRLSFIRRRWAGLARSGGLQSTSPISAVVSTQCPTIGRRRRISRCGRAQLRARFYHYAQQAICRVHGGWQSLPKSLDSLDVLRPAGLEE